MKEIFSEVLHSIKPRSNELKKLTKEKLDYINKLLKDAGLKAKAVAGGSVAKETYLKNDFDVDIFAAFDMSYANKDISKLLGQAIKPLRPELVHGSRDYFHIQEGSIVFEIIPVLKVKEPGEARNVTDMSIHHVRWAQEQLKNNPKLRDEIRLAKAFCKGIEVYGAESYIRGFSGHTLDILISYYGSFLKLLRAASSWEKPVVIDINNAHKGKAIENLNKAKVQSPMVLIDPVDPMRNASASLDEEKFDSFVKSAAGFLKKPSKSYFEKPKFSMKKIQEKAKGRKLIMIEAEPLKGKTDVSGAKLLKAYQAIEKKLLLNDFNVISSGWYWHKSPKAKFWYIVDKEKLERHKERLGPPVKAQDHSQMFKKKHPNAFEKNGRLYAKVRRDFVEPEKLVKELVNENEMIKSKVKSISIIDICEP